MKKFILVIFTIFLMLSSLGCIDQPEPPGADLPRLIIDYDETTNETIIHLRAMEIERFENITLEINETKFVRQDAFSIEQRTGLTHFELDVKVLQDKKRFHFNATFELKPEVEEDSQEKEPIFKITYPDKEKELIYKDELPHKEILGRIGEEES